MNFLIPVHNEALYISRLLRDIYRIYPHARVCLVDSCCSDESISLARSYPIHLCKAQEIGYAQALLCGYQFLVAHGWEHAIQIDADGQHDVSYARVLHYELNTADWVIGSRHKTGSHISARKKVAFWLGRRLLKELNLADVSSGYWALNRRAIHYFCDIFPLRYTEAPLRLRASKDGLRIKETSLAVSHRDYGVSMHAGIKGFVHGTKMLGHGWLYKKKHYIL